MKRVLTLALIVFSGVGNANLIVTDTNNATDLTNMLLGSGISIVGTPTIIGNTDQSGTFIDGLTGGLGIDQGIVLTSGSAQTAASSNNSDGFSVTAGTGGNAILTAQTGSATFDQNVLSFDFMTTTDDLFFSYVFASEEYNEYVNSKFNDGFTLLLNGVNIAIAPDGLFVTINNVNCGNPYDEFHVTDNCSYFNNNDLNDGGPLFDIQYDGFTDVFTASALGLGASVHNMTFIIADTGDSSWDSAVFIEAGSFSAELCPGTNLPQPCGSTSIPEPSTIILFAAGVFCLGFTRRQMRS
ncbi:MAG: PEP-CTERM sorting domain-containing protein [Gammaproteobacteria bacterium]|nr:PEP-CTERM sorting domain-containing protein [Gammaproteobacteria bacterium]